MDIKEKYFEWMYETVCSNRFANRNQYRKLLDLLNDIPYRWIIDKDENRAEDGEIGLRWRFACETHETNIYDIDTPCSVLEMILAMAYRCEEIMDNTEYGDRTVQWFWSMISNLGLNGMTDDRFDQNEVEDIIERFLDRAFEPDGHGSLFVVKNCRYDLRDVELWSSMTWYLDNIT